MKDYVTRVPEIIEVEGVLLQRFVEGVTLGARYRSATQVPERFQRQIMQVFADLAAVRPEMVSVERRCAPEDRTDEGDSAGFLERLMHFMEVNVYQGHLGEFGSLFQALGVHDVAFKFLRDRVEGLRSRPFHLLHADLHRENLIIDRRGQLWPIDWELAMFGDPLYDLATHLHLMRYPKEQERRVVSLWRDVMRTARMAGAAGLTRDLPLLLDFKRAQSVFTDVIRTALTLREVTDVVKRAALLQVSAGKLHWVLERGAAPMGLGHVPSARSVGVALQRWLSWGVNDH
ncbi:phosphotransferase [Streptomyces sp. NPDC050145]|uniref:phosphotransferase n=1 Tax=Streptomyces sp. NPDC050145 TaxID=3365602 RepID=UPI0037AC3FFC